LHHNKSYILLTGGHDNSKHVAHDNSKHDRDNKSRKKKKIIAGRIAESRKMSCYVYAFDKNKNDVRTSDL